MIGSPNMKEVKKVIFCSKNNSACGLHGLLGEFYKYSWEITKSVVLKIVMAFLWI